MSPLPAARHEVVAEGLPGDEAEPFPEAPGGPSCRLHHVAQGG